MTQVGDDCYFFYNATCTKGAGCPFRHVEEAKTTDTVCNLWRQGHCFKVGCPFRHSEIQNRGSIHCYWENQPGGCTKPHCPFLHSKPKTLQPAPPFPGAPSERAVAPTHPAVPPQRPAAPNLVGEPPTVNPRVSGPPHIRPQIPGPPIPRPPIPSIHPHGMPLVGAHMLRPPPGWIPPAHQGWLPPTSVPPPMHAQFGLEHRLPHHVEPVIVNLNSEESDQESMKGHSPLKGVSGRDRLVVEPDGNILDYFLLPNRKQLVRPRSPERGRSVSPDYRRSSLSPRSHDGSHSPERVARRRSASHDRVTERRRSNSLDRSRSQSPDWRDSYRRRSRSRSVSPGRRHGMRGRLGGRLGVRGRLGLQDRPRDLRDKLGTREKEKIKGPELEEVKVPQGPKIVTIKKDKDTKEEEETSTEPADVEGSTVKSLEEIYRERALQSMMTAKRNKVLEKKAARWTGKGSQSETESKGSEKEEEKSGKEESAEESQEGEREDEQSDVDLDADVDIELDVGEVDPKDGSSSEKEEECDGRSEEEEGTDSVGQSEEEGKRRIVVDDEKKTVAKAKPSVKSRLGLKGRQGDVMTVSLGAKNIKDRLGRDTNVKRTIKQRLGDQEEKDLAGGENIRKGVIRLNRSSIKDRLGLGSDSSQGRFIESRISDNTRSEVLMLPRITIKQDVKVEEAGDNDSLVKSRKTKLKRLKHKSEDEDDLSEDEHHKRKKKSKSKKDMSAKELEERSIAKQRKRLKKKLKRLEEMELKALEKKRQNIEGRLSRQDSREEVEEEDEEEAVEKEVSDHEEDENEGKLQTSISGNEVDNELTQLRVKSLEEIRKEKAERLNPSDESQDRKTSHNSQKRNILLGDEEKSVREPAVHVTFGGDAQRRKLVRLNRNPDQDSEINISRASATQKVKTFKRERQIYQPPALKRSGGPLEVDEKTVEELQKIKRKAERELLDYGDVFFGSKKTEKTLPVKPVKLQPVREASSDTSIALKSSHKRVEKSKSDTSVSVKTFAEIMAEKKRKRLQKYTPIVFDEGSQDTTDSPSSGAVMKATVASLSDSSDLGTRLSPSIDSSQQVPVSSESSRISAPVQVTVKPVKSSLQSSKDSSNSEKLSRWKKRKSNGSSEVKSVSSPVKLTPPATQPMVEERTPDVKVSPGVKRSLSAEKKEEESSGPVEEKKTKMSESFLDLESELLNMDDDDIDLDLKDDKDHDELMRELDELLA